MNARGGVLHEARMNALVLALVLTGAPQSKEPPPWEIFIGAQAGVRPDTRGFGGVALFGVNRVFFGFLRPELWLGAGAYANATDVLTMFRGGVRFEWPGLTRWRPFVNVSYAHQQEAGWEHVKAAPGEVLLGLGGASHSGHAASVRHRNGLEAGAGVAFDFPLGRFALRLTVKGSFSHFFEAGPPNYVELTSLLGFCF